MLRPSEHTFSWFVGYIVVFFLLWTAYVALLYPLIAALGGKGPGADAPVGWTRHEFRPVPGW